MPTPAWSSSGSATKRPDDKLGIAFGYAHISKRAQQLDSDYRTFVASTDYNARSKGFSPRITNIRYGTDGRCSRARQGRQQQLRASRSKIPPVFGLRTTLKF